MNHIGEEQLVLFYYGESAEVARRSRAISRSAKRAGTNFERCSAC